MRAGAQTLTLLGAPRNALILRALAGGPRGQLELRRAAGSPAQSTLRGHLKVLEAVGAIAKRRRDAFPGALDYELTEPGERLLDVAEHLGSWLACAPAGPLELGSDPARAAVKGLVDGWQARMLAPLASGPLSLTELDKRLSTISYPTIERRLETMRLTDQIDVGERDGAGTPYILTTWLRQGIAPLAVATRWEHRYAPDGASPITRLEVESALTIAAPLLSLAPSFSGICQLAVRAPTPTEKRRRFLGMLEVREGEVAAFIEVYPQRKPDVWASATVETWFATVIDGDRTGLRLSGDRALAEALFDRIHEALFATAASVIPGEVR